MSMNSRMKQWEFPILFNIPVRFPHLAAGEIFFRCRGAVINAYVRPDLRHRNRLRDRTI